MHIPISPLMIVSALGIGAISAYLAHKRGRNPYTWFAVGFLFGIFGIFAIFFASGKKKKEPLSSGKEAVFFIQGPKDKFWYYLDPSNQQLGPMSYDAVTAAWHEGKINMTTLIWHEELPEWKPFKEVAKIEGA